MDDAGEGGGGGRDVRGSGTPPGPVVTDALGHAVVPGRSARLLALPDGFCDGIPEEDAAFLLSAPGTVGEIEETLPGTAVLMLREGKDRYRFLYVPGQMVEMVDDAGNAA